MSGWERKAEGISGSWEEEKDFQRGGVGRDPWPVIRGRGIGALRGRGLGEALLRKDTAGESLGIATGAGAEEERSLLDARLGSL